MRWGLSRWQQDAEAADVPSSVDLRTGLRTAQWVNPFSGGLSGIAVLSEGVNRICREDLALRKTIAKCNYLWVIVRSEFLRVLKHSKGFRRNDVVDC